MQIIDFSRSFVTFRIDLQKRLPITVTHPLIVTVNNARIQLDCVCQITSKSTGACYDFVLGCSCKTERVGAERDIWSEPNADFIPIFSKDRFLTLKTFDRAGRTMMLHPASLGAQPERHTGTIAEAFDRVTIHIHKDEGELVQSSQGVIDAALNQIPLMARTEFETDQYTVSLEYPVKTIDASERDNIYQTDTGPILFPDLSRDPDSLIEGMELAFCAFNCADWAEFIVRVPTSIADDISVYHYSRSVHLPTRNSLTRRI